MKIYIPVEVSKELPAKSDFYFVIFDKGQENQIEYNKNLKKFIHLFQPRWWLKKVEFKESAPQPGPLTESKVMEVFRDIAFVTPINEHIYEDCAKAICKLTPPPSVSEDVYSKVNEVTQSEGSEYGNGFLHGIEWFKSHPQEPGPDFELKFCDACYSMTNHLDDKCQRCERLTNGIQNKEEG